MKKYLLPQNGNFYKANLHCHTNVSDGKLSPKEIKEIYKEKGYSIVAFTDHDVLVPHPELNDDSFLALNGYEMEIDDVNPIWPQVKTCHICYIALKPDNLKQVCYHRSKYLFGGAPNFRDKIVFDENEPDYERVYTPECICDMMKKGRDGGFFVTYNHPVWSMETASDYMNYDGMHAMEMVNYSCKIAGFPEYNPIIYDEMLRAEKRIFCISTDDNHNYGKIDDPDYDSFGGFTVIKADNLRYTTITDALLKGNFYASEGPEIKELWYEDGVIHVKSSPAKEISITTGARLTANFVAKENEFVNEAEWKILPDSRYVRVTITDINGKHANSNAYFIDELEKE